jgi:hypothetical protein
MVAGGGIKSTASNFTAEGAEDAEDCLENKNEL